jgi:ankyrin repeat protein
MSPRRWRLTARIGFPVLLILAGLAAYFCFPSLRLRANAGQLRSLSGLEQVDAHHYDQEWFDAARVGRIDILAALYDAHYPLDAKTHAGYTALILAAYDEQSAALDYLLLAGADPCLGDRNGNTALMGALYKGELPIAWRLLKTRCPIDQMNNAGETALSFAALFGRLEILPELVALGADPNHVDARGDTPLVIARKQGNAEAAAALRKVGATH